MILPVITRLKKAAAILVALSFLFSNVVSADIPKNTNLDAKKDAGVISDPDKIIIPRDYGLIKSRYAAKDSKKLIIHIQDAHCNYEAQSNIIKILECLIKNDGLRLVSVEGADGFIDTSWFKAFPDADIRKEVADYFMKKGEITGPEYLSITSDYPIKLFGAETRSYYIDNLSAFTSSYPLKEDTERYFNQIKTIINRLKDYIYNEELRELDAKDQDYEAKKLSFTDYVRYLERLGEKHRVNLRQYENLFKLISVLIFEKKINFNVVDKERASLIDIITKKLDKEKLTELVNKSLEFKVGKIASAEYYSYLKALSIKFGISLSDEYPNLFNYIIYNAVYSRIENEQLFDDIKRFEQAIKEKLFANDDQRTLEKLSRHINILIGLVNIRLLNGDFGYYKSRKEEFTHEAFADFIEKMTTRYGFAYEVDAPSEAVKDSMPKLEDFYAIAIKRDKALVDNTIQAMRKEDIPISVLVTGGFHSEGIMKLLEKQNISYVVVCPNITKDVETPYIKILTNQRTPLEEILSDTTAATTDAKNIQSGMLAPYLITAARINKIEKPGIQDRADADLKLWAEMNIRPWLPVVIADLDKMHITPTAAVIAARFNGDVDKAVEKHITVNGLQGKEAAAFRANARNVQKISRSIIEELLSAQVVAAAPTVDKDIRSRVQQLITKAKDIFKLGDADTEYLAQMWAQYLIREKMRKHGIGEPRQALRIITDLSMVSSAVDKPLNESAYDPDKDGNFILAATLTAAQREKILGAFSYADLARDSVNAKAAQGAVVTLNSLDGGIGESIERLEFLKEKSRAEGKPIEGIKLGAKGTDLGVYVKFKAGLDPVFVSIAEIKLLQLVFIAENKQYAGMLFQPIVNYQSKESYDNLLDNSICLFDRFSVSKTRKRTYRQLLEEKGMHVLAMVEQPDLPGIGVTDGNISINPQNPHQPGGHGQLGFLFLYDAYSSVPPADGKIHIRIFYNGDNVNSRVNENITGFMARKNIPIIKLTTAATPIDKKGGKDGVRVINASDGRILYVPDQMEERDAKNANQTTEFYSAGMENGFGEAKVQPFNTNIFYVNTILLHSILNDLVGYGIITKEKLWEIISPILIDKDAKKGLGGQNYIPIDGAIGTAMHGLNGFYITNANPKMETIRRKYGDRLLYFVDVPRTQFFTPVKKTYDMWMQGWSDYYESLDTDKWELADAQKDSVPPEFDLEYLGPDKKEGYWNELQNLINSLGNASTSELKSLKIRGMVLLKDAKLIGNVSIINNSDKTVDLKQLEECSRFFVGGKFILDNVSIVINKDGAVEITSVASDAGAIRGEEPYSNTIMLKWPDGRIVEQPVGKLVNKNKILVLQDKNGALIGSINIIGKVSTFTLADVISIINQHMQNPANPSADKNISMIIRIVGFLKSKAEQGRVFILGDNPEGILGFADAENIFISNLLINDPIAVFHEAGEGYFAAYPDYRTDLQDKGINPHTYLRGLGSKARLAMAAGNIHNATLTESERNLIKYCEGLGLQDMLFGTDINDGLTNDIALFKESQSTGLAPAAITINSLIRNLILENKAYALIDYDNKFPRTDKQIPLGRPNLGNNEIARANLDALIKRLQDQGINLIIIKGLGEEQIKRTIAPRIIFHPGVTRKSVYTDETNFKYLLSLENGVDIIMEGIGAKMNMDIDNPRPTSMSINNIDTDVVKTAKALGIEEAAAQKAVSASINKVMLLNDFAESVGIPAKDVIKDGVVARQDALSLMVESGLAVTSQTEKAGYDLTPNFFDTNRLSAFMKRLVASSDNPKMVDLTLTRIQRIMLNSIDVNKLIGLLSAGKNATETVRILKNASVFPTLIATWDLSNPGALRPTIEPAASVALTTDNLVTPGSTSFYAANGVNVEFSLPANTMVNAQQLAALQEYQNTMVGLDMARGGYNYRGTGTRQTVEQFFNDYFAKEWYGKIVEFVNARFSANEPLKAIVTNGIGANDQFMWSLVNMYNANRPANAPEWFHVTTARGLASSIANNLITPKNTLFIDISRSGSTWEGVEVGMRSIALGFNKRIAIANGSAFVAIAKKAAELGGYRPLIIGISPDIGGRNMHRKTSIYYTAQAVAGMYLPAMKPEIFAALNNKFDEANAFSNPETSLAVSAGKFLQGAMNLLGVEHIAMITNTEPLRLAATEWEQYIMEGSNKEDVISLGIHNIEEEPEHVLANLAKSPAGKKSIGMALLDMASPNYKNELAGMNVLKEIMPLMIFTINGKQTDLKGGISPNQQAAFDILWTDLVTVFTTLLRVDANSNPNVKVVRQETANREKGWKALEESYANSPLKTGEAELVVSYGNPQAPELGTEGKQESLTMANAAEKGKELASQLAKEGMLVGRSRLNLFVGREDLKPLVSEMRNVTYMKELGEKIGWITQTAVFPLWSHKGLEANLAYSTNPARSLLANKTVNIFFNARTLGPAQIYNQPFNNMGIMSNEYEAINGATIHQTNEAMTLPNIKRMAEVSPTILLEFNEKTENIEGMIKIFYEAFIGQLGKELSVIAKTAQIEPAQVEKPTTFEHTVASIIQSSAAGERARKAVESATAEESKDLAKKHLIFVKTAIPAAQRDSTTAINLANFCKFYYNELDGYTADVVDSYEKAVELLAKNADWDRNNTIVGLIDSAALDKMSEALTKYNMTGKTKLLAMEKFSDDQFVPIKGFFDLMATLVRVNRPLDKDKDRELLDGVRELLSEIGVKDIDTLLDALSAGGYFEDPIKFAKSFIIRLLPPAKPKDPKELKALYDAAKKVVESL